MIKKIWFDMDGTIADLYGVTNWLDMLINNDETPYMIAKPMINTEALSAILNELKDKGYEVGIISWLSKNSTKEYDIKVTEAKKHWLKEHLPLVRWNEIKIVPYGINKKETCKEGILFDDEYDNRNDWGTEAYEPKHIMKVLKELVTA